LHSIQRSEGKAFDHWEGELPVNFKMGPNQQFISFFLGNSNSTNYPETNFILSRHDTNVTAVFTDSFTFADTLVLQRFLRVLHLRQDILKKERN
jgi:hypothetical protein